MKDSEVVLSKQDKMASKVWGKHTITNKDDVLDRSVEKALVSNHYYTIRDCTKLQLSRLCLPSPTLHHSWVCLDNYTEEFHCIYCSGVQFLPTIYSGAKEASPRYGVVVFDEAMKGVLEELRAIPVSKGKIRVGNPSLYNVDSRASF